MKISIPKIPHNPQEPSFFTVQLTKIARSQAQHFCQGHAQPEKRKQIYLNTLAVYAVNYYLKCLNVKTNLTASDSWNPIIQNLANVADLVLPNKGKLECCPAWLYDDAYRVSPDALNDRIGYVVVWFDNDLNEASLLGFAKQVTAGEFSLSELQPLQNLVPYLDTIGSKSLQVSQEGLLEKICNFLTLSWQQVEPLLTASVSEELQLAFGYRSSNGSGTIGYLATDNFSFQKDLASHEFKLSLAVMPQSESAKIDFIVELSGESLPDNLKLEAQEHSGEVLISEIAEAGDTSICLQFAREWKNPFDLIITWESFKYVKRWEGKLKPGAS